MGRSQASVEEEGGNPRSATETLVALRVDIDNWRWADAPFYLRTCKLAATTKRPARWSSTSETCATTFSKESYRKLRANRLIIKLQPDGGRDRGDERGPGSAQGVAPATDHAGLSFSEAFRNERIPDAYERLLLEAMPGNPVLFIRRDEVEQAWTWVDSIQDPGPRRTRRQNLMLQAPGALSPLLPFSPGTTGSGMNNRIALLLA